MSGFSGFTARPTPPDAESGVEKLETSFIKQVDKLQHELEAAETTSAWIERCERDIPDVEDDDDDDGDEKHSNLPTLENRGGSYMFPPDVDQTSPPKAEKAKIMKENRDWERHCAAAEREGWDAWKYSPGYQRPEDESERSEMHEESGLPKREYLLQLAQRNAPREPPQRLESEDTLTVVGQGNHSWYRDDDDPGVRHRSSMSVIAEPSGSRRGSFSSLGSMEAPHEYGDEDPQSAESVVWEGEGSVVEVVKYDDESDKEGESSQPEIHPATTRKTYDLSTLDSTMDGPPSAEQGANPGEESPFDPLTSANVCGLSDTPTPDRGKEYMHIVHGATDPNPNDLHEGHSAEGETRIPQQMVYEEALLDLGYAFDRVDDFYVLPIALHRAQLDEIMSTNQMYVARYQIEILPESSDEETVGKRFKKGSTRIPKPRVWKDALLDLGYPHHEERYQYVLPVALAQAEIDELLATSQTYDHRRVIEVLGNADTEDDQEVTDSQPSRGATRFPKHLASREAIEDLGYAYDEYSDHFVVRVALEKKHIDEVIKACDESKEQLRQHDHGATERPASGAGKDQILDEEDASEYAAVSNTVERSQGDDVSTTAQTIEHPGLWSGTALTDIEEREEEGSPRPQTSAKSVH